MSVPSTALLALPSGPFRCIVADPPWRYKTTLPVTGNAPGRTRQNGRSRTDYPTMSIDEVAAIPVRDLLHPEGSHVYLWTTNAHAEHAWRIMRAWGCEPKQLLTWAKKPKGMIGFGAFSPCSEFCLFGSSAKRTIHAARSERTWWEWPRTIKHSEKPQGFFDVVEAVSPGPRLELFARRVRQGWTTIGGDVDGMDVKDSLILLAQGKHPYYGVEKHGESRHEQDV